MRNASLKMPHCKGSKTLTSLLGGGDFEPTMCHPRECLVAAATSQENTGAILTHMPSSARLFLGMAMFGVGERKQG